MMRAGPVRTDIVLLGGGHAHVHVLKAFAMRPEPGVRLTLVTRDLETPVFRNAPGRRLPGSIPKPKAHIDLVRLSAVTGTRLIHAEAIGLDRARKRVLLAGRPPIAYDLLSIDVGITPALAHIAGAAEHGIAVKPIGSFLGKFAALRERCRAPDGPRRIAVIGGGAGGVELILSVRTHLLADAARAGLGDALLRAGQRRRNPADAQSAGARQLPARARRSGIALHERRKARAVTPSAIELDDGQAIAADAVLVTTGAAAPPWFRETGLALDKDGFLAVGPTLQTLNDPDVFGAGDCVTLVETPREKAGVFAVRAGPPLAGNLRRRARGEAPKPWRPQKRHLALISTGERYAIASRGPFKVEGAWVWRWKDWIDRRWMRMYQDTDAMRARMRRPRRTQPFWRRCAAAAARPRSGRSRCRDALSRLPPPIAGGVMVGLDAPDDAAVLAPPKSGYLVQTVDFFRAFIDDPFVFGEIAANHALNDVFAMGGTPRHALATAVVPIGPAPKVEEALFQLLSGARACLDREGVALVGGHSSEGMELVGRLFRDRRGRGGWRRAQGRIEGGRCADPDAAARHRHPVRGRHARAGGRGLGLPRPWRKCAGPTGRRPSILLKHRRDRDDRRHRLRAGRTSRRDAGRQRRRCRARSRRDTVLSRGARRWRETAWHRPCCRRIWRGSGCCAAMWMARPRRSCSIRRHPAGLLAGIPAGEAAACVAELRSAGYAHAGVIGHVARIGIASGNASLAVAGRLAAQ